MFVYWRASEASETLSGVTQSRFRYIIYWRASETVLGVDNAKSGICIYVCIYVWIVRMPFKRARGERIFFKKTRLFRLDPCLF